MPKILVAEDDHNLAHYYEMLLSQWNCETVVEQTGRGNSREACEIRMDVEPDTPLAKERAIAQSQLLRVTGVWRGGSSAADFVEAI
jgi:hypothetical protein